MPFTIVRQDITHMKVDAIVNAANNGLQRGGGVCGAIFKAAGEVELQAACDALAHIKTGEAVITPGFALPARYIIHTAGPVYQDDNQEESEALLRLSYLNSLKLAALSGCESIAFPLISSGIYGYPKPQALRIATQAAGEFLADHEMDIYLAVFDKAAFTLSEELMGEVDSYIDEHYVLEHSYARSSRTQAIRGWPGRHQEKGKAAEEDNLSLNADYLQEMSVEASLPYFSSLDRRIDKLDEPFSQTLLRLIDQKGKTDVEVYKKANLDRKLFSKIRSGKGYLPSKRTVLALAISLQLSRDETDSLLSCAGFALSRSQKFDVIVEYFIEKGRYSIFEINEVLFSYDQPLLGG